MKTRTIGTIVALIVVAAGAAGVLAITHKATPKPIASSKGVVSAPSHDAAMLDLLKAQTGDAYDQMFITMMSEHHAGAVAMANFVVNDAKHSEIRTLGQNIITAQTKEIADMKDWAAKWGYTYEAPNPKTVEAMAATLKGFTGDALDKHFITDMIGHHQDALAMANLSATRAKHAEIKTLSANIIATQTAEISQMQGYASTWGYSISTSTNSAMDSMHM